MRKLAESWASSSWRRLNRTSIRSPNVRSPTCPNGLFTHDVNKLRSSFKTDSPPRSQRPKARAELDEDFQFVMKNSTPDQLMSLISMETEMTKEMRTLLWARDFDMKKLRQSCEDAVNKTRDSVDNIEDLSYNLSMLNEKLRISNSNYSHQIQALIERQVQKFSENVQLLRKGQTPTDFGRKRPEISTKAEEPDEVLLHESFTIYIGSQLKTMHNARIVQCSRLTDICHLPVGKECNEDFYNSQRLRSLMSLFGRDLSAAVILVERDPLYHVHSQTPFFRICENAPELHFPSLTEQLKNNAATVRQINQDRKESKPQQQSFDHSVQLVFHLVADKSLETGDITSRHPCINGLRNCVRLMPRNSIKTLSFPLFLVDDIKSNMTVPFCLNRAELIFKCFKGFLMEINSANASSSGVAGKSDHYNVNFVLPSKLNRTVFDSIVDNFRAIFHEVPMLNG
ncbi:Protein of unknown function DUF2362 family-containing protein [Aphelenchoides fujianensis]|nr:Protein of unknown function DUF2362 family-containing protein [Aphelenchoides fujianensis]